MTHEFILVLTSEGYNPCCQEAFKAISPIPNVACSEKSPGYDWEAQLGSSYLIRAQVRRRPSPVRGTVDDVNKIDASKPYLALLGCLSETRRCPDTVLGCQPVDEDGNGQQEDPREVCQQEL